MRVLPDVRHLVRQGLAHLLVGLADEAIRVEREFVVAEFANATGEPIRREVAERMRPSLVRYKNVTQLAVEQRGVEVIVRCLQPAVFDRRDRGLVVDFSFVMLQPT